MAVKNSVLLFTFKALTDIDISQRKPEDEWGMIECQ